MEVFLIVLAIFSAVLLVFRYAVTPKKPKLGAGERLGSGALDMRIQLLAKRCKTTVNGFGVSAQALKIKKLFNRIQKRIERGDTLYGYEYELINSRELILRAERLAKSAVRLSYTWGHVDGYPRLYLLCHEIVTGTQGDVTAETLDNALSTCEKAAPLSNAEKQSYTDVIRFCLCMMLYYIVSRIHKPCDVYSNGLADGSAGKVDLDRITDIFYVCGVIDGTETDTETLNNLLEINGVDRERAKAVRAEKLARVYAQTKSIISSLNVLEKYKVVVPETVQRAKLSNWAIRVCNIAPLIGIVVIGVLTCVFIKYNYAAVFAVLSILIYAGFRLPVLIYAPTTYDFKLDFFKKLVRRNKKELIVHERVPAEIAYFGGEPELIEHEMSGKGVKVNVDNRGCVTVRKKGAGELAFDVELFLSGECGTLSLCQADGILQKHKSVYSVCDSEKQMTVGVVASPNASCCLFDITVINRTAEPRAFMLAAACTPKDRVDNIGEAISLNHAVAFCCESGVSALSFDTDGEYGCDLIGAKCNGVYNNFGGALVGMTGERAVSIGGFSKIVLKLVVVFGNSLREAERIAEYSLAGGYARYAADCASELADFGNDVLPQTTLDRFVRSSGADIAPCAPPRIFEPNARLSVGNGLFLEDGSYSQAANRFEPAPIFNNIICGKNSFIECSTNGISSLSFSAFGGTGRGAIDRPLAFAVIGENGVLWSPTNMPLGRGELRAIHYVGGTRYECAFNGCVCAMNCFTLHDKSAAVFELKINNREEFSRYFDIMFSVDGMIGENVFISSSEDIVDSCKFKEGYFVYGNIDRVNGFRSGGSTAMPTVSVSKTVPPCTERSILFVVTDGGNQIDDIENVVHKEKAWLNKFAKIKLHCSDPALEYLFGWSLYKAYSALFTQNDILIKNTAIILSALKYFDTKLVRRMLIDTLSRQSRSGRFEFDTRESIFIFGAVFDYCEFTKDKSLLSEPVSYAPSEFGGMTVTECESVISHFLRAVFAYLDVICAEPHGVNTAICVCRDYVFLNLLHKSIDYCKADEKRMELIKALSIVASRYSNSVHRLKSHKFLDNESFYDGLVCARALYLTGEYEKAYSVLKRCNIITYAPITEPRGEEYALYYITVAEMLLGISVKGKRIKLNPGLAASSPRFKIDLSFGRTVQVDIDNGNSSGEWKLRIGDISYSVNTVDLDNPLSRHVLLFRE